MIAQKRSRLEARVTRFHGQGQTVARANEWSMRWDEPGVPVLPAGDDGIPGWIDEDDENDNPFHVQDDDNPFADHAPPRRSHGRASEHTRLRLPSNMSVEGNLSGPLKKMRAEELNLRIGHANDILQQLRILLAKKSFLFRTSVRSANSQQRKTRARKETSVVEKAVRHQVKLYYRTRAAMVRLGATEAVSSKYQALQPEQIKVSTAVVDPNARGQRLTQMPWFWRVNIREDVDEDEAMMECESMDFSN